MENPEIVWEFAVCFPILNRLRIIDGKAPDSEQKANLNQNAHSARGIQARKPAFRHLLPWAVRRRTQVLIVVVVVAALLWVARGAGPYLSVNNAVRSDAILVLAGDSNDQRYMTGLSLLQKGMARDLFLDSPTDLRLYGRTPAEMAADFIQKTAGPDLPHVHVCPTAGDSTREELTHVGACLDSAGARSVIVVSDGYHTRRALSTARRVLPKYQWTAAGVPNAVSQPGWWHNRYGLKYAFLEWQRLLWWKLVESHGK